MAQFFQVVERLNAPFYAMIERGLLISSPHCVVQAKMRKIEFVLSGRCRHRFKGQAPKPLTAGDVLVVPYRVQQIYEPLEGDETAHLLSLIISLDADYLPFKQAKSISATAEISAPMCETIEFIEKYFPANVHLDHLVDSELMDTLTQMRQEAELRLPGFRWRISGLCNSCVVQLARNQEQLRQPYASLSEERRGVFLVSCAKEYLLEHLTQPVRLHDIASHLHVSREHLARTFKRVAGQSLFTYFRHLRLEQAKLKLLNSEKNVTEIATECGFSSVALFCRSFKEYTTMTPLAYRDEFGAKAEH